MTQPIKTIVVAVSRNGIIGREGDMPWRLSSDLKRFKAMTLGKPVVMGRKTFQSIGRPLPGRPNIVITRDTGFSVEGIAVVHSLEEGIEAASRLARESDVDEICILGGGEIYRQAIGVADRLLITHVEADVEGDTAFPAVDPAIWQAESELAVPAGEKDTYPTRFVSYFRRKA
ncbi:dihydrofolate reductase [Rhizobium sp. P40RR-XXII]|uniref:dihydrofolate reductase n=1 Tax=unclassified Rhizobium TaxID=2613769 RepID=UPI0014573015|nr:MULTISPECIES: dihydrofolate reductase [unclassified Rhizobium]NLR83148.1 dihydrofolate reductase [Rhizobium sp. P28RR-XV]NLS20828.1 dihydrofolate reductase [Rhizobium sp. P40RR-XXII]